MSGIGVAMTYQLLEFFGSGAFPSFHKVEFKHAEKPFQDFYNRLNAELDIDDLSFPESDVGTQWRRWTSDDPPINQVLRLSFVGPYALVYNFWAGTVPDDGHLTNAALMAGFIRDDMIPDESPLIDAALAEGFIILDKETLDEPVQIWEPEYSGRLYEFLFEFDAGTPWDPV